MEADAWIVRQRWVGLAVWITVSALGCVQESKEPLGGRQPPAPYSAAPKAAPTPYEPAFVTQGASADRAKGAAPAAPAPAAPAVAATPPEITGQPPPLPTPTPVGSAAPASPSAMRTVATSPEAVAQGKALFGACAGCHDPDASGRVGIGPRIASDSFLAAASDTFLVNTITHGRAGTTMIPWGQTFKPEQIGHIVAYLRSLHPVEPAQLDESPLKGDPAGGAKIFADICSGCHGNHGAGYQETANGTGIGRKAFLDKATNGFIRYVVKNGKTLTQMKGFSEKSRTAVANLTDQEVEDTIAYLRENAW